MEFSVNGKNRILFKQDSFSQEEIKSQLSRAKLSHFTLVPLKPDSLKKNKDNLFTALLNGRGELVVGEKTIWYLLPSEVCVCAVLSERFILYTLKANDSFYKNLFIQNDIRKNYGRVYLVGAGPGDPELLTRKAWKLLQKSDIVFHDALIDYRLLEEIKIPKISTGKKKGYHQITQKEINQQMYSAASKGKNVIRLKGGDPFIFGRGWEELDYLFSRFIDVEIVPGVTAASAASALSFIPLTSRDKSSQVYFCTGHPLKSSSLPLSGTLVYYMAATVTGVLASHLISKGWSEKTLSAIIERCSLPQQRMHIQSLKELKEKNLKFASPSILIIGETVKRISKSSLIK